jgi:hypothetical protein
MADPVDEAAERLYGLPLDEFTVARNAAARELRDRGLRAEADEVKALAKPSAAAWAVNQLTRRRHADLDEFLEAAAAARDAQLGGGSGAREAVKELRAAVDRLVRAASEELGGKASDAVLTRIRQSLEAAAVDDEAAEEIERGRLTKELDPAGFGTLAAHAKPRGKAGRPQRPTQDAVAARKALADARARLREAEDEHRVAAAEERQAHKRWQQARSDAEEAAERVEQVRRELEELRSARQ